MEVVVSRTTITPEKCQFRTDENVSLRDLGSERIFQVFRASLVVHANSMEVSRIWDFFVLLHAQLKPFSNFSQLYEFSAAPT